jgi:hypothetical protein
MKRPHCSYSAASFESLSSYQLLKQAHEKLASELNEVLKSSQYISLLSDRWSNERAEHMVNYVAVTPN